MNALTLTRSSRGYITYITQAGRVTSPRQLCAFSVSSLSSLSSPKMSSTRVLSTTPTRSSDFDPKIPQHDPGRRVAPQGNAYKFDAQGTMISSHTGESRLARPLDESEVDEYSGFLTALGVDNYLSAKLTHPEYGSDPTLAAGQVRADEANMPHIAVSLLQGQFLAVLVKSIKAEKVLEIGTLAGYSTSMLAKALPSHGQIDTIEFSPLHAKIAQTNFLDTGLYPFPTTYVGPALDILKDPKGPFALPPGGAEGLPVEEQGYDLVFIDANKDQYFEYFLEALRLTKKGGLIVLDNAIQQGRIAVPDGTRPSDDAKGLRKVFDWIAADAGKTVLASALQTVGDKAWDGFALVYKN